MTRPPWWYWAGAIVGLWWALLGVVAWTLDVTMDPAQLAELPEAQRAISAGRPKWMFAAYGAAVFSLLAGAIGLLLRRRWSFHWFLLSLAAFALEFGYLFLAMDAVALLGPAAALPTPVVILVCGVLLLWLAHHARRRGWHVPRGR